MKEKIVYKEKYRKFQLEIKPGSLPVLRNLNDGFEVSEAYIVEAGLSERGGEKQEYQVLRIYFSQKHTSTLTVNSGDCG